MSGRMFGRRRRHALFGSRRAVAAAITAAALVTVAAGQPTAAHDNRGAEEPVGAGQTPAAETQNPAPFNPEWLAPSLGSDGVPATQNNLVAGTIERRDEAARAWRDALAAGRTPDPLAKPEYAVVWSAKQTPADVNSGTPLSPQGLRDALGSGTRPATDGWVVIDVRKHNIDGSPNPDYAKVVNLVQIPPPWGVGAEAHHMQYQWEDGDPMVAGGVFNAAVFVADVSDIPNIKLTNIISPDESGYTVPDAFESLDDGRYAGTYMGSPPYNFGGAPGALAILAPDPEKGLVLESIRPVSRVDAVNIGNPGGVPEPCTAAEARPLGTCANPHGVLARPDLDRMVTIDFADPRELVMDPIKPIDQYAFRPTVRTWDISNTAEPKLVAVAHAPKGWRTNPGGHNRGLGEGGETWPPGHAPNMLPSKGVFSVSLCGGGILFNPDITRDEGDSSGNWRQIWDDSISQKLAGGPNSDQNLFDPDAAVCPGGPWLQVAPNNRAFYRAVMGSTVGGSALTPKPVKVVYSVDIQPMLESYNKDGKITCNLSDGMDLDGDGTIDLTAVDALKKLAKGEKVADCPRAIDSLLVDDQTTGGPHWGVLDNHTLTADGYPTRLVFDNYFVSRTGVDGDHKFHLVNIDREGRLSYDQDFRDEVTGEQGVDFDRTDWPGAPDAGFYKPHAMLLVCPPGICTDKTRTLDPIGAKAPKQSG